MKTCTETLRDENQRLLACMNEAVPGLSHCREHALERLRQARLEEDEVLKRIQSRAVQIAERELVLFEMHVADKRDRCVYLSVRGEIVAAAEALARNPES